MRSNPNLNNIILSEKEDKENSTIIAPRLQGADEGYRIEVITQSILRSSKPTVLYLVWLTAVPSKKRDRVYRYLRRRSRDCL